MHNAITQTFKFKYHLAVWLCFIMFDLSIEVGYAIALYGTITLRGLMESINHEFFMLIVKIPAVYCCLWYLLKYTSDKWSIYKTVITSVITVLICAILYEYITTDLMLMLFLSEQYEPEASLISRRWLITFIDLAVVCFIAVAIYQSAINLRTKRREKNLVKEKLEAELKFLQLQTNPHFLFNTLNNIYALARNHSEKTTDAITKLTEMLNYMLYESRVEKTPLINELRIIESYIELEKIRFSNRLNITFDMDIDDEQQPVAPLLFLNFVENAFKHGASESRFGIYIHIVLTLHRKQLVFVISNSKEPHHEAPFKGGIGLKSIRRQLNLLYPRHTLDVVNTSRQFIVTLKISL